MRKLTRTALLAIAALLSFPALHAVADEAEGTLDKVARTGEFVIGYRADSSPLSYENASGQPSGYSVDICRRIAASVNAHFPEKEIKTRFQKITADERISAVVDGKVDIECGSTTITLTEKITLAFTRKASQPATFSRWSRTLEAATWLVVAATTPMLTRL